LRAIEYGYSLVRQASGDVAMTVDDQGRVLAATDYHMTDQQTMVAYVPIKGTWTIYGLVGDLFTWLCITGLLTLTVLAVTLSLRRSPGTWTPANEPSMGNAYEETY
jgi:apolipoprotein N-acyltransferase